MRNFHLLMSTLAIYDLLHLILDLACFSLPNLNNTYKSAFMVQGVPFIIPVTQVNINLFHPYNPTKQGNIVSMLNFNIATILENNNVPGKNRNLWDIS